MNRHPADTRNSPLRLVLLVIAASFLFVLPLDYRTCCGLSESFPGSSSPPDHAQLTVSEEDPADGPAGLARASWCPGTKTSHSRKREMDPLHLP